MPRNTDSFIWCDDTNATNVGRKRRIRMEDQNGALVFVELEARNSLNPGEREVDTWGLLGVGHVNIHIVSKC